MADYDVAVIGGGLAGLIAAAFAARGGAKVALFEAGADLGGRARTKNREGYRFNLGAHALYRGGALETALKDLAIAPRGGAPPVTKGFFVRNAQLHRAPFSVADLLTTTLLNPAEKLEITGLLARLSDPRLRAPAGASIGETIDHLAKSRGVRDALHALVRLSSYAHAPDILAGAAGLAQLRHALTKGVLYLDDGWDQLIRALVIAAGDAGAALFTERRVERVSRDTLFRIDCADGECCTTRAIILALGPWEAHALFPALDVSLNAMTPARAACLDIGLERLPRPDHLFALGIDTPTYFSVHSTAAQLAPKGHALVHVLRYIAPGETPDKDTLIADLEAMMDLTQPGWRGVERARQFLPLMIVAHDIPRRMPAGASRRARVHQGGALFLAGDWVGDEAMLSDCAAASARAAAQGALQSL